MSSVHDPLLYHFTNVTFSPTKGHYSCSQCTYPLFSSSSKYEHSSPWPAFTKTVENDSVKKVQEPRQKGAFKVWFWSDFWSEKFYHLLTEIWLNCRNYTCRSLNLMQSMLLSPFENVYLIYYNTVPSQIRCIRVLRVWV